MDLRTGLAFFNSLWLIEPQSALALLSMWEDSRKEGARFSFKGDEERTKALDPQKKFFASDNIIYAPTDAWSDEAENFKGFDGAELAVIPLQGPLMKNDFCGYYGTASLLSFFKLALQTDSVQAIAFLTDTPGGTVDGTQTFANAIKASTKPTGTVVENIMGSAGYWIGSSTNRVIATSNTNIFGSIGTMVQWYDRSQYLQQNGIVLREYYATKSEDKNKDFRDANKGDGKLLVQSMLDPTNDEFLSAVQENRQGKIDTSKEDVLTGKTYLTKAAIANGLADESMSMQDAFGQILEDAKRQQPKSPQSKNLNMSFTTKFPKLAAMLGFKADSEKKEISMEEHGQSLEAVITERDTFKAEIAQLKDEKQTLETAAATAKTNADTQAGLIAQLQAELVTEKAKPGAAPTTVTSEQDASTAQTKEKIDAAAMDFQKELFAKL